MTYHGGSVLSTHSVTVRTDPQSAPIPTLSSNVNDLRTCTGSGPVWKENRSGQNHKHGLEFKSAQTSLVPTVKKRGGEEPDENVFEDYERKRKKFFKGDAVHLGAFSPSMKFFYKRNTWDPGSYRHPRFDFVTKKSTRDKLLQTPTVSVSTFLVPTDRHSALAKLSLVVPRASETHGHPRPRKGNSGSVKT